MIYGLKKTKTLPIISEMVAEPLSQDRKDMWSEEGSESDWEQGPAERDSSAGPEPTRPHNPLPLNL